MFKRFVLVILLLQTGLIISASGAYAQDTANDTLKLTIKQAEY
jgi:hypothetical protein